MHLTAHVHTCAEQSFVAFCCELECYIPQSSRVSTTVARAVHELMLILSGALLFSSMGLDCYSKDIGEMVLQLMK